MSTCQSLGSLGNEHTEDDLHTDGSLGSTLGNSTCKGGREPRLSRG